MLSSLRLEAVACRFEPVVKDLRSFLKDNGVAYGFPEHLLSFTDHLTEDDSLRQTMSGKLHAIVSCVPETTSHGDLVEVLLLSVGGFALDEDTPPMQKAERTLSRLIGEVMTSAHTPSLGPPALAPLPVPPPPPMAPPVALLQEHEGPLQVAPPALAPSPEMFSARPTLSGALLQSPVVTPPASPVWDPPSRWPAFARTLLARLPERQETRPSVTWTPAPRFVWAALVCGALFPPGMYLISQPHAASPSPRQERARPIPPAAQLQQSQAHPQTPKETDLDRQTDEDLASIAALGFGTTAAQPQAALARFRKLRSRREAAAQAPPTAANTALEADLNPHKTDTQGHDLSSLAPASSGPQSLQGQVSPRL